MTTTTPPVDYCAGCGRPVDLDEACFDGGDIYHPDCCPSCNTDDEGVDA